MRVTLNGKQTSTYWLLLNDVQGRLIRKMEVPATTAFSETIDLKGLPNGVYTLTVSSAAGRTVRQIVKE